VPTPERVFVIVVESEGDRDHDQVSARQDKGKDCLLQHEVPALLGVAQAQVIEPG